MKKIINNYSNWNDDSLYIHDDDINIFIEDYSDIFGKCVCQNLKEYDSFDPFGINYYSKDKINNIKEKLLKIKPKDYEIVGKRRVDEQGGESNVENDGIN